MGERGGSIDERDGIGQIASSDACFPTVKESRKLLEIHAQIIKGSPEAAAMQHESHEELLHLKALL